MNGVPPETVEAALLLGSVRRLIRPKDAPTLSPIRSLAYFQRIIEELIEHPAPKSYLACLRLKLQQAAKAVSANVQKMRSLRIANSARQDHPAVGRTAT
jgi:hypothetical protein